MKKWKIISILLIIMLIMKIDVIYAANEINSSCDGIFTDKGLELTREILNYFRILAPIVLIVLIAIDFGGAVMHNDQEAIKNAAGKTLKRILALVGLFMVPTFIIVLSKIAPVSDTFTFDPLCASATGTKAKEALRDLSTKTDITIGGKPPTIGNTDGSLSGGGDGSYSEGAGNSGARIAKTVTYNGRTYNVYYQGDFGDVRYQSKSLAEFGCGPIAFTTAVSGFNKSITPWDAPSYVKSRTFGGIKGGLDKAGVSYSGPYFYNSNNRNEKEVAKMASMVRGHLSKGKPVIALVAKGNNGETKYAGGNHFITILGQTSDGKVALGNCMQQYGDLEEIIRHYLTGGRKGFLLVG